MYIANKRGKVFLSTEKIEHHVFLNNFQKIDYHIVFLKVPITSVLLEKEFQVFNTWVLHADCPSGK